MTPFRLFCLSSAIFASVCVYGCRQPQPVKSPPPTVGETAPVNPRPIIPEPAASTQEPTRVTPATYVKDAFNIGGYKDPVISPNVQAYTIAPNFSNIRNWKQFSAGFTSDERDMLKKNLFLALEADRHQMAFIYEENGYQQSEKDPWIPSFVTTDAILHTYHVFFDYLLRTIETRQLSPAISQMTTSLLKAAVDRYNKEIV